MSSSNDFSIFSLFTAGLACFAPLASAYTQPTGGAPVGNPFSEPGLTSVVPVGKPFTVSWVPTTDGTVTLVLLKGPSDNAVPQYAIAEKIPNSGSYAWTPAIDLAPGQTGYGLELIDDATGQYQYTTQFGISNPDYSNAAPNGAAANSTSTATSSAAAAAETTTSASESSASSTAAAHSSDASLITATAEPTSSSSAEHASTTSAPASTGHPRNGTVQPTGSLSRTTTLITSTTGSTATPTGNSTGGAGAVAGRVGAVVFAAGMAVLLV